MKDATQKLSTLFNIVYYRAFLRIGLHSSNFIVYSFTSLWILRGVVERRR